MSVIKVNKIENTSTADGGVAIDVDGHVTIDGQNFPTAGPLSNRNLIINGAMRVAQRATQVTGVTATGFYTCDRMEFAVGALGTWTVDQSTDAPQGFSNSFKVTCTTADATPASTDIAFLLYQIEGQDLQHLNFGTNNAQPLTLSFWVKSNKTGDASIGFMQPDASNRLFSTTYNISAADTWEPITIPIPADTAGQINNDQGSGLRIDMYMNSGSNFTGGSPQDWGAITEANRNTSNLGVGGAVNDYWQITGVQLEVGSKATPFEHRSYGDELKRCQRYYQKGQVPHGTVTGRMSTGGVQGYFAAVPLVTTLRATPTINSVTLTLRNEGGSSTIASVTSVGGSGFNDNFWTYKFGTGGTSGYKIVISSTESTFDAEL